MEEDFLGSGLISNSQSRGSPHNQRVVHVHRNGEQKSMFRVGVNVTRDDLWKVKKRVLKKLDHPSYKDSETQKNLRLFTIKGVEIFEYDNLASVALLTRLYFSYGEDFDYSVRLNTLKFIRELGKGGFGVVNLMRDEVNGCDVAVKHLSFKNGPIDSQMMKKEVVALSNLEHRGIVKLIDSFPMPEQDTYVVIMEYLCGGELYEYWCRFPERKVPERECCEVVLQLA